MSNTCTIKRDEQLVDSDTVFDETGVTSGPSFNISTRQSSQATIQVDWRNNTGDIDVSFYGRAHSCSNYSLLKVLDCDGNLQESINILDATGSHQVHFARKFQDIDVRFVVNSGQADITTFGIIE